MKNKFKVGQTVYMDRGDKMRELVIARVIDNPLIPIYQYAFEAPHDGFVCGEQDIRANEDDDDLRLRDVIQDQDDLVATKMNTILSAKRNTMRAEKFGLSGFPSNLFFRPNIEFWIGS